MSRLSAIQQAQAKAAAGQPLQAVVAGGGGPSAPPMAALGAGESGEINWSLTGLAFSGAPVPESGGKGLGKRGGSGVSSQSARRRDSKTINATQWGGLVLYQLQDCLSCVNASCTVSIVIPVLIFPGKFG